MLTVEIKGLEGEPLKYFDLWSSLIETHTHFRLSSMAALFIPIIGHFVVDLSVISGNNVGTFIDICIRYRCN